MAYTPKRLRARKASQRAKLTFEHLEKRQLFSVSPQGVSVSPQGAPTLEHMVDAPPVEHAEATILLDSNFTPLVYAGADVTVNINDGATINGEVIANIPLNLSVSWDFVSGPGSVAFSNENLPSTAINFSQAGTYLLELTASNGGTVASDRVTVTVEGSIPGGTVLQLDNEMTFTGNNDHVVIPHDNAYLLDEGTVAFWFKADNISAQQGLFSKDSSGNDTGGHLDFQLNSSGAVSVRYQSASSELFVSTNDTILSDTWHHIAFNFGSGGVELFLDGVSQDSNPYTGGMGSTSGGTGNFEPIVLGASSWGSGDLVATPIAYPLQGGALDDIIIFNHALTTTELAALVATNPGTPFAPVASNSSIITAEGFAINGSVTATDANGDPLTYIQVGAVSNGILTFNSDGSYTYTPNTGFVGSDAFTFKANDGELDSNIATVTVSVQVASDEEVLATNNPLSIAEGNTATITAALLTTTDTDNSPTDLIYTITSGPSNGTVLLSNSATTTFAQSDINAGLVTYQHNGSETTSDSIGFIVNDAQGPGTSGTFNISVTPVNDTPVASDDSFSTEVDTPVTIAAAGGVLANDTDADGDTLNTVLVGGPSNGTLTLNADGSFTYTPNTGFTGTDTFSYKANDGTLDSTVATVAITIGSDAWFSDSFEDASLGGDLPQGWSGDWDGGAVVNGNAEGIGPLPDGSQAYRQFWNGSLDGGLIQNFSDVPGMPNKIGRLEDGAAVNEFSLSYSTYYHPNFDWGNTSGLKQIIIRNDQATEKNQFYINLRHTEGFYNIRIQHVDTSHLYSNVNGPAYTMPKGEWVHFKWEIKVSPEVIPDGGGGWIPNPNINGSVKGYVNDVLRWDYSDIATIEKGSYATININNTFNPNVGGTPHPNGPDQKRYWDSFSVGLIAQ